MDEYVFVSNDPAKYIKMIQTYQELGFEKIDIHNVNKYQEGFVEFIGKNVLPVLK